MVFHFSVLPVTDHDLTHLILPSCYLPCNNFGANPTCVRKISPCANCRTEVAAEVEKGGLYLVVLGRNRCQRRFSSGEEL